MSTSGGGSGPIESAFIEITADTTAAQRNINEVGDELTDLDRFANLIAENIARHFRETGEILSRSFEEAKDASTRDLNAINQRIAKTFTTGAATANEAIDTIPESFERVRRATTAQLFAINKNLSTAFKSGAEAADEALDEIGGADAFANAISSAEAASAFIARAFGVAARRSDESLENIGGVDAFANSVLGARISSSAITNAFSNAGLRARISIAGVTIGITSMVAALGVASAAMLAFGTVATAQLERTEIAFTGLFGSAEAGGAFLEELLDLAATTPFEVQGLADASAQLLAFSNAMGIARNDVLDTLTVIGDITTILGQPIEAVDSVVRALGQIASRGQVMTEELIQLSEALPGFEVFSELADGLGVTTEALDEMLREGTVPAQEAIEILLDSMRTFPGAAGAMADASQTLIGLFSTLKDEVRLVLVDAFQPFTTNLRTTMREGISIVGPAIEVMAAPLNDLATRVLTGLVDSFQSVAETAGVFIRGLDDAAIILEPFIRRLIEAGNAVGQEFGNQLPAVAQAITPFLDVVADLAQNEIPRLIVVFGEVAAALEPTIAIFSEFAGFVLPLVVTLLEAIPAPVLAAVLAMIQLNRTINTANQLFLKGGNAVKGFIAGISPASLVIGAAAFALGAYASEQAAAAAAEREHEQQLDQFSATLREAETATAGVREEINRLIESGEGLDITRFFQDIDVAESFNRLGLSAQQATELIQDGSAAVGEFAENARDGTQETDLAVASLAILSENMQEASDRAIEASLALGDFTEAEVEAALEANTASDGTINYVAALNDLKIASQESEAAALRQAEAEEARREAMEATTQVTGLLATEIRAVLDNTGDLATDLARFGAAASNAELDEQQMAAAADQLGISVSSLGSVIGIVEGAMETFAQGIESTFPSIVDAVGELDTVTFDGLLETFRETFEAAVNFEANLAALSAFPNVQAVAAQAGPQVAAVLAQGFEDGKTDALAEMELLGAGTRDTFDRTLAAGQEFGINFAADQLDSGIAATDAFETGLQTQVTAQQRMNAARIAIQNAKEGLTTAGAAAGQAATSGFGVGVAGTSTAAANAVARANNAFTTGDTYSGPYGAGQNATQGFIDGMNSLAANSTAAANAIARSSVEAMNGALGNASPSKEMRKVGQDAVAGFALGLSDDDSVLRATDRLVSGLTSGGGTSAFTAARGGDTINVDVHVTAGAGVTDSEARRQSRIIGDGVVQAIERRKIRSEVRRA